MSARYYCTKCEGNHNKTSKKGIAHIEFKRVDDKICPNCGLKLNSNIVICWRCGECVDEHIAEVANKDKPKTTNLENAVLKALTSLRRARTSTIARKLQTSVKVVVPTLVSLRKKGLVKSKDGATEKVWTKA